jgi:hypothetical protein
MFRHARTAAVARFAAALVALALSGAPHVLAMHAPPERHRCSCHAQGGAHHECECAICRKEALAAQATDESLPPCHRVAARKALSGRAEAGGRGHGAPCIEGTCGREGRLPVLVSGVEPFCGPAAAQATPAFELDGFEPHAAPAPDRAIEPSTPRPRPV